MINSGRMRLVVSTMTLWLLLLAPLAPCTHDVRRVTRFQELDDRSSASSSHYARNDNGMSLARAWLSLSTITTRRRRRAAAATDRERIVTTACNGLRTANFRARLDLFYFYMVEYGWPPLSTLSNATTATTTKTATTTTNATTSTTNATTTTGVNFLRSGLDGLERAVATAVAEALNECDALDRPLYAVELWTDAHTESDGGHCDPSVNGDECMVVRGLTSILLDRGQSDVEIIAYDAIEQCLLDTAFLRQFTTLDVKFAQLIRPIGENLVLLPEGDSNSLNAGNSTGSNASATSIGTAKVAVAAALVSFVMTAIFFYGLHHRKNSSNEIDAGTSKVQKRISHYQAKRRKFFHELQDDPRQGRMAADPAQLRTPSTTWSISDLTSDSQSIRSSLPLERIDEEGPEPHDDGDGDDMARCSSSPAGGGQRGGRRRRRRPVTSPEKIIRGELFSFIADWESTSTVPNSDDYPNARSPSEEECKQPHELDESSVFSELASVSEQDHISPPLWELETDDDDAEDDDEATPVRANRIEAFDARLDVRSLSSSSEMSYSRDHSLSNDPPLQGCQFLDDHSMSSDLDRSHDTSNIFDGCSDRLEPVLHLEEEEDPTEESDAFSDSENSSRLWTNDVHNNLVVNDAETSISTMDLPLDELQMSVQPGEQLEALHRLKPQRMLRPDILWLLWLEKLSISLYRAQYEKRLTCAS